MTRNVAITNMLTRHETYQNVLGLDVAVHDVEGVKMADGGGKVVQHATGVSLCVTTRTRNRIKQVSTLPNIYC